MRVVETRKHDKAYRVAKCQQCHAELEYLPARTAEPYVLRCCECGAQQAPPSDEPSSRRRRGTPSDPLSREYYDILQVDVTATQDDIKRSYRRLAAKMHPDKPGGSEAEFHRLSEAYSTLSVEDTRRRYNEFGKGLGKPVPGSAAAGGGAGGDGDGAPGVDIEKAMSEIFGGGTHGLWHDIVGDFTFLRDMSDVVADESEGAEEADDADGAGDPEAAKLRKKHSDELKEAARTKRREEERRQRIATLTENLRQKLDGYAVAMSGDDAQALQAFRARHTQEAQDLKAESYGVELCHLVGQIYSLQAASNALNPNASTWSLAYRGYVASLRLKTRSVTSTISVIRKAYGVKRAFERLSAVAEKEEDEARKKQLEEEAAKAVFDATYEGIRSELLGVLGEVCTNVFTADVERAVSLSGLAHDDVVRKRVVALETLGEIYQSMQADPAEASS